MQKHYSYYLIRFIVTAWNQATLLTEEGHRMHVNQVSNCHDWADQIKLPVSDVEKRNVPRLSCTGRRWIEVACLHSRIHVNWEVYLQSAWGLGILHLKADKLLIMKIFDITKCQKKSSTANRLRKNKKCSCRGRMGAVECGPFPSGELRLDCAVLQRRFIGLPYLPE